MRSEVAHRRIESFGKRFGEAHLYLAYQAAFPLALTPELLYRLWANFQRDIHGRELGIPWIAVADLLLSSLCDEVGHELYEMDVAVRNLLLSRLKEHENFGQQRINQLSYFLFNYVRQQLDSHDPDIRDFAQAQHWVAIAYTQPSEAARELTTALSQAYEKDRTDLVRLSSLVETLAEPLADFEPLLIYARQMRIFDHGNQEATASQFQKLPEKVIGLSRKKNFRQPLILTGVIALLLVSGGLWNLLRSPTCIQSFLQSQNTNQYFLKPSIDRVFGIFVCNNDGSVNGGMLLRYLGFGKAEVKDLQKALNAISQLNPPLPVDGNFGSQSAKGLAEAYKQRSDRLRGDLEQQLSPSTKQKLGANLGAELGIINSYAQQLRFRLSGPYWSDSFPTSRAISDLASPFRERVQAFQKALSDAGAQTIIAATYRPPERAYLMHYAGMINRGEIAPENVPPMPGVDIDWVHYTPTGSRQAAAQMVDAFGIGSNPVALASLHTQRLAIDWNITWEGTLKINDANGQIAEIGAPQNGASNTKLWDVGASYGVYKGAPDPPHWSYNGL